jgi:chitin synthase
MAQLLLLWSLSNALLASVVLSGNDAESTFVGTGANRTAIYMLIILCEFDPNNTKYGGKGALTRIGFVAGMAIFRFICSTLYLITRVFTG